jgi:hypothetical protein
LDPKKSKTLRTTCGDNRCVRCHPRRPPTPRPPAPTKALPPPRMLRFSEDGVLYEKDESGRWVDARDDGRKESAEMKYRRDIERSMNFDRGSGPQFDELNITEKREDFSEFIGWAEKWLSKR